MSPQITITQGTLQGKVCRGYDGKKYYSFEGIPYAKPPVGKLRFREPEEPENWTGILDATKPGNKCAQIDPFAMKNFEGSEDCLYLNVYTPSLPYEKLLKLPVIVFIHGGRLIVGHGDYYKPDYLIRHDVIVVSINYRLNILGFLCLNTPEVPGNAGLKDTVMALRWVKKNICFFNGDENNVTAFGESAGSGIVTSFLVSKMTEGLCQKVIAESGNCLSELFLIEKVSPVDKAKHVASILGKELNDVKELYTFLMNAPVEDLVYATTVAGMSQPPPDMRTYFLCVVEKKFKGLQPFFEEPTVFAMRKKRFRNLPIITGTSSHEGALFLMRNEHGNIDYLNLELFIPYNLFIKENSEESRRFGNHLHKYYFGNKKINDSTKNAYLDFVSDAYFNRDALMFVDMFSKTNKNIFVFNFAYFGNMNTRIMKNLGVSGATHGDIIQYQFYRKSKAEKCDKNDQKTIDLLSEAWCNFARTGKPTWSQQETEWLPFTEKEKHCLVINDVPTLIKHPIWDRYEFWKNLMRTHGKAKAKY